MPNRRVLSIWFPRLAAERVLRTERGTIDGPLAVVGERGNVSVLVSLDEAAEAEGLALGQPVRDAQAMCPRLVTRIANSQAEEAFLASLRRWAGKFSPWVADEPPAGLVIDLTGCAHLFGGEAPLLGQVEEDCADLGLSVRAGIADTVGAAWALARFSGRGAEASRSGDAIDIEAPATRSRAAKRRSWEKGGVAPAQATVLADRVRIAAPGQTRTAIASLPVTALRIDAETATQLGRLGLRRIEDLAGQPRAALARRFGTGLVRRLDQAMGVTPEPVSPAAPPTRFAVRLTLPDPIGLEADILAALDRLLPALSRRLAEKGHGARRVRMQCFRTDQAMQWVEVGLARPSADPERIRPLLAMKVADIDAGFGIDAIRIEAILTEPVHEAEHKGGQIVTGEVATRHARDTAREDLVGRLGARIGLEAITRLHPADSHIPEKTGAVLAAAWSEPAGPWPFPSTPRPLTMWRPEPVMTRDAPKLPGTWRWRGQTHRTASAIGPERIAPEWWLDEPEWRSGVRDYWQVTTEAGDRLWLYYAHGGLMSSGWFCQGRFA
jgi:protein ImuB